MKWSSTVQANPNVWKSMEEHGFSGICQWRLEVGCSEEWQRLGFNVSPGMGDDSIVSSMTQRMEVNGGDEVLHRRDG